MVGVEEENARIKPKRAFMLAKELSVPLRHHSGEGHKIRELAVAECGHSKYDWTVRVFATEAIPNDRVTDESTCSRTAGGEQQNRGSYRGN